jgi:predicted nucleic acid-binding protein
MNGTVMADLLVDTDIFVDHIRGSAAMKVGSHRMSYSVITRCELFAGRSAQEESVGLLLAPFSELSVDRAIAERAGRIRRTIEIRTPDALIAATALEHGLGLMTRNDRDFKRVAGLKVIASA